MNYPEQICSSAIRLALLSLLLSIVLAGCKQPTLVKDWQDARELKEQAEAGDVQSQYRLGINYANGHGVLKNHVTAVSWFQKAAEAGHRDAQFMLGAAFYSGRGIGQDHRQAVEWFLKSAGRGHMRAQYQLGDAYMNGRGVARDRAWGARWYGMAAAQGHGEAQFYLSALYSKGIGLPRLIEQSVFWMRRAELSGHDQAAEALKRLRSKISAGRYLALVSRADRWRPTKNLAGFNNRPTVIYVQHVLNHLDFDAGFPDGIRGPKTDGAITRFQRASDLAPERSLSRTIKLLRLESRDSG